MNTALRAWLIEQAEWVHAEQNSNRTVNIIPFPDVIVRQPESTSSTLQQEFFPNASPHSSDIIPVDINNLEALYSRTLSEIQEAETLIISRPNTSPEK